MWGIEPVKKWTAKVISRAVLRLTGSFRAGECRSVRIAGLNGFRLPINKDA
jgi:hypothetical protein